jgi:ATP-dependent protease HslVU (ClpYQ) peptidase subunit
MTCIVGLVENGKVYIGADSAGASGYSLMVRKDRKVFRVNDVLIGGTTSFRMLQLLQYSFVMPEYDLHTDLDKYMSTAFIDAVRQCLKDGGYATRSSDQESGGQFLVGFRGRLFYVGEDYQVGESLDGYDAVGCGSEAAKGAMFATHAIQPNKRIELALQASERHNIGVRGPFHIEMLQEVTK